MRSTYDGGNKFVLESNQTGVFSQAQQFPHFLQVHSSSANCARELFKPSKDLASLQIDNEKMLFDFGFFNICE